MLKKFAEVASFFLFSLRDVESRDFRRIILPELQW